MEEHRLTDEQIELAAEWWGDQVCAPEFKTLSAEERKRPDSQPIAMAEMLATTLVKPIDTCQRQRFVDELTKILQKNRKSVWRLAVDYGPDMKLSEAARLADVPFTNFPWKTSMYLLCGKVEVSAGYGAEQVDLNATQLKEVDDGAT